MMNKLFDFKLPKGLIGHDGELHNYGEMRLLTAKDELILQDLFSRDASIDIVFLLMSQAIAKLGSLTQVTPQHLEQLFLLDFEYLQNLFSQLQPQNVNASGES